MTMDHVGKDVAGNGGDAERVTVNGRDLEQPCRGQEPAADHVSRGLAIGHFMQLLVEGAASFLVVFWSCVAALMQEMHHTLTFPMACLVVALAAAFVIGWLGPAHFNAAVTITFAAFRYFPWTKVPFYVMLQLGGSVLACLSVNGIMKPREEHFHGTVSAMAGHTRLPFLLEFLGSAVLMVVIATVAISSANQTVGGLAIGATVGTLGLIIGLVSGGSMNPVRTLGPAIVLGKYTFVCVGYVSNNCTELVTYMTYSCISGTWWNPSRTPVSRPPYKYERRAAVCNHDDIVTGSQGGSESAGTPGSSRCC